MGIAITTISAVSGETPTSEVVKNDSGCDPVGNIGGDSFLDLTNVASETLVQTSKHSHQAFGKN